MKTSDQNPSEVIKYIGELLKQRHTQNLPTYYSISIEQYGKVVPLSEKEEGAEKFSSLIKDYIADYSPNSIIIKLFTGKSRRVKDPFETFQINFKKQSPAVFLGDVGKSEVQQVDSGIPVGRYYDEKFELQLRLMRVELEKQVLTDRLVQLTERYEEKLKDQQEKNKLELKNIENEVEQLRQEIAEYEQEIANYERAKNNSFGNIALGSIGARMLEGFAKSDVGTGMLKGLLGKDGFDTLQGHLAGIENEKKPSGNPSARIIQDEEPKANDKRTLALGFVQKVGEKLTDMHLRMLYDIAEMTAKNPKDLEVLWSIAQQIKEKREQETVTPTASEQDSKEGKETDEDTEQDTKNIT